MLWPPGTGPFVPGPEPPMPGPPAPFVPTHLVVNSLKTEIGREFDRDESAKNLITEDDLRGLPDGAKLRVAAKNQAPER